MMLIDDVAASDNIEAQVTSADRATHLMKE